MELEKVGGCSAPRKVRTLKMSVQEIQERKIREDPWQKRSRSYRRTAAGNISSTSTMLVG
jgi:hypothetical protein